MKYDVFICYSRHDAETALKICDRLERAHVTVFSDAFSLIGSEDFAYGITDAIINSQCLLYLHSEYSIQSNWIRKEIEYAIKKGLQVIPVNLNGFSSDDTYIRKILYNRMWLDYDRAASDCNEQFEMLVNHVLSAVNQNRISRDSSKKGAQNPSDVDSIPPGKKNTSMSSVKTSWLYCFLCCLIAVVVLLGVIAIRNDNYAEGIPLLIGVGVLLVVLLVLFITNAEYKIRIHNTDSKKKFIIRVDGKEERKIGPLEVIEITRRRGEYVISAQAEDSSSEVIVISQLFNRQNDGKIISISPNIQQNSVLESHLLKYRCFIAGSTAITNERNAARAVLSILYNQYEKYDFYITAHTYEDFNNKHKIDGHQYDYDTFIKEKADCTIFIICKHVGDKTLKEYSLAIETFENTGCRRPAIFVYNDVSDVNDINQQDPSVLAFRKLVEGKQAYWRDYNGIDMLMLKIKEDLGAELTDVLEMRPSISRDHSM